MGRVPFHIRPLFTAVYLLRLRRCPNVNENKSCTVAGVENGQCHKSFITGGMNSRVTGMETQRRGSARLQMVLVDQLIVSLLFALPYEGLTEIFIVAMCICPAFMGHPVPAAEGRGG